MPSQKVFIGWGPGGNFEFEKTWFKDQINVIYWEQPSVPESGALTSYLASSEAFLSNLIESGKTYELVVHSFGAQILIHWINFGKTLPFSKIKILAANLHNFNAYQNLGNAQNIHLFDAQNPTLESFWANIQELLKDPHFNDHYWSHPQSAAHVQYQELQKTIPHINLETFQRVVNDFILQKKNDLNIVFKGIPVEIHLGSKDRLLQIEQEKMEWSQAFPEAKIFIHETGHFVHFEKPELF